MSIEDTYITKGVNVSTGDINYGGAVIVNGDVTDNMKVIAKGNVTINGYVESAYIHSDGDIIINGGATGKIHDEDCRLIAGGSIHIEHAQGLDIIAGNKLTVAKQLAYSRVNARGGVRVGSGKKPMGSLFACSIHCGKTLTAGSLGAISGSVLLIDFSEQYNVICNRLDELESLHKKLSSTSHKHEHKLVEINRHQMPNFLANKLHALTEELNAEHKLLAWLFDAKLDMQKSKSEYERGIGVLANNELFPGVTVKLNERVWRTEREYQRCEIALDTGVWQMSALA